MHKNKPDFVVVSCPYEGGGAELDCGGTLGVQS